jgi:adenylosuccinate lyase
MQKSFCPLDDRYTDQMKELSDCVGEISFMKYRLEVEIKYFLEMLKIKNYTIPDTIINKLLNLIKSENDFTSIFTKIKEIEKKTKHDVKAV